MIEQDEIIDQDDIEIMKKEIGQNKQLLNECIHMINIIKNSFPYNQKQLLQNDDMIRRKKDVINEEIIQLESELKSMEKKLEKMIG